LRKSIAAFAFSIGLLGAALSARAGDDELRGHIIFHVQGMKAIHANQQHVLDLVATQFVITRACRNRSTEQGETQSNRCDAFSQENSPFMIT